MLNNKIVQAKFKMILVIKTSFNLIPKLLNKIPFPCIKIRFKINTKLFNKIKFNSHLSAYNMIFYYNNNNYYKKMKKNLININNIMKI